jgi:hypothetical protein
MLERYVNEVSRASTSKYGARKFRLRPCPGLDTVMLVFADYERITSTNDDDRRLGASSYREFLVMQLALSEDREFPELDWFIPFIYLDTDAPRLAGREIYGYPKQFATIPEFEYYEAGGQPLEFAKKLSLSTVAFRQGNNTAGPETLIEVEGISPQPPAVRNRYANAQEMFLDQLNSSRPDQAQTIIDLLHGRRSPSLRQSLRVSVFNALLFSHVGNVFLKQFRDCADPRLACYQAVCKTDTTPAAFHSGASVDPRAYRIKIDELASDPLLRYVSGESADVKKTLTPVFAYAATLDFELTNGRVIVNPFEAPYVPDVSASATHARAWSGTRIVRRSFQSELLELSRKRRV